MLRLHKMKKTCLAAGLLMYALSVCAQTEIDTAAVRAELNDIYKRDQKTRTGSDSAQFIAYIDSCNLAQVEALIAKY